MPLSLAALEEFTEVDAGHIAIALPLDSPLVSLALWLAEKGFSVSVLSRNTSPADLQAVLHDAGIAICSSQDALLTGEPDVLLDVDGALLAALPDDAAGGTIASLNLSPETAEVTCPAIHLGASPVTTLALSHGLGQATVSGFLDITNLQIAGSHVLVIGFDAIGEGVARYARGYGARVIVTDADPVKAFKATLEGFGVEQLADALSRSVLVINTRQSGPALIMPQLDRLPDGSFLCSASANPEAFPIGELNAGATARTIRDHVDEHTLASGKRVRVVCEGSSIAIATGQGLPLEYADIQIAAQIRSIGALLNPANRMKTGIRPIDNVMEADLASKCLRQSLP